MIKIPIEVIDKIKPVNNGSFKIIDAKDVEMQDGKNLEEAIKEGIPAKFSHIGISPPNDINLLWIDTTEQNIDVTLDTIILNEFRSIISNLRIRVSKLEDEVQTLKLNGGNENGGNSDIINGLITENGEFIITENDINIIRED